MAARGRLTILALSIGMLVVTGSARAEPACKADVQKHCADAPAAGGKVQACLKTHEAQLSQPCRTLLDTVKRREGPLVGACAYDIALFCAEVTPGEGRVASCLEAKRDQLTPECRDRVGKRDKP